MPSGRSKKAVMERRARALAAARLYIIAAVLLVVSLLVVWELVSGGGASALATRVFGARDLRPGAERLNEAVDASLVRLGVLNVSSETEEKDDGRRVWRAWEKTGLIPYGSGTFYCNAGIAEAARAAGGEIIRVKERGPDWRGAYTLDLRLGVKGVETHHVVLRESRTGPEDQVERGGAPRIALLIDDFGYSRSDVVESFLGLDFPISFSILPGTPYCESIARSASERGIDVLVHLPMEPSGYPETDPGDGALLLEQSHWEIRELTNAALGQVPGAVGVNNHMGSAFCRDRARMSTVIAAVESHGMFYVDSMTTPESKGFAEARKAGVATVRNNMFIDSPLDETGRLDVHSQMVALEEIARRRGFGLGIGHPHEETLRALMTEVPEMMDRGIEFVLVSKLVE